MRQGHLPLAALATFALVLTACGGAEEGDSEDVAAELPAAESEEPGAAEEEPVDVPDDLGTVVVVNGIAQTFEFMPQQLGHELGVWEARGLEVDDILVGGGGQVGQTMAADEADIGLTTAASALAPILGGHDAPIIGEVGREFTLMVMCVGDDFDGDGPSDMENTTVGITSPGSGTDFLAESLAENQGWEMGVDIDKAPIGGLSEQVAALQQGTIDGFIWTAEACFALEEQDEGRVLFSFGDIVQDNVFEVIVAQRTVIEERPEAVQAYLEGWYEATQWMKDNRDETIEWLVENWELSETVAANTYDLDIDNLSTDGTIPERNLQGVAEGLVTVGQVDEAPEVDLFWDDRFVPVSFD
jgi:ABC-type nitrate/sulfonate/bicarbonate transport system substrate-binding protein